jgi:hypothetical protein
MHRSAALLALAVSAPGCAPRSPPETARGAQVDRPAEVADPSVARSISPAARTAPEPPGAWRDGAIAEREARIEALRQQLERADGREDEQEEDVKARLERELELEEDSLHGFREQSTKRHSPGMIAGGLTIVGVGTAVFGAAGLVNIYGRPWHSDTSSRREISEEEATAATVVLLPIGASCLAVGLPLLFVGARSVPKPGPTARLWVGPGEVGVRGSF